MTHLSQQDCMNLRQEVALHAKMNHPNIVRFLDSNQIGNTLYLLLELADKNSLIYYIDAKRGLPESLALRFFCQTALAVKYLHDHKIIHRDIKPENILLCSNFEVKLCDFGWSCQLRSDFECRTSICGTYEYMSPEILNLMTHSFKTDIWCLGILLFELLNGTPPHKAQSFEQMLYEHMTKPILLSTRISASTRDLMTLMLQQDECRRIDIDQVLAHPGLRVPLSTYRTALSFEDVRLLENNYNFNTDTHIANLMAQIDEFVYRGPTTESQVMPVHQFANFTEFAMAQGQPSYDSLAYKSSEFVEIQTINPPQVANINTDAFLGLPSVYSNQQVPHQNVKESNMICSLEDLAQTFNVDNQPEVVNRQMQIFKKTEICLPVAIQQNVEQEISPEIFEFNMPAVTTENTSNCNDNSLSIFTPNAENLSGPILEPSIVIIPEENKENTLVQKNETGKRKRRRVKKQKKNIQTVEAGVQTEQTSSKKSDKKKEIEPVLPYQINVPAFMFELKEMSMKSPASLATHDHSKDVSPFYDETRVKEGSEVSSFALANKGLERLAGVKLGNEIKTLQPLDEDLVRLRQMAVPKRVLTNLKMGEILNRVQQRDHERKSNVMKVVSGSGKEFENKHIISLKINLENYHMFSNL